MYQYEIRGKIENLSLLTANEVNSLLKPIVGTIGTIRCLCSTIKPFVHVSRRGNNYFPTKEKWTGHLHKKSCRHHSFTLSELTSMGYTLDALCNLDNDELLVSLAMPLKNSKETKPVAIVSVFNYKSGAQRNVTNQMTQLGLLHLLWESANMHEHKPNSADISIWPAVRGAASKIWPRGLKYLENGLSDMLLIPLHADTENQKSRNVKKLLDAQKRRRFLLFVAKLSKADIQQLLLAEISGFSLKEKFGISLVLYANCASTVLNEVKHSFNNELNYSQIDGDDLIVLGIAQPDDSKNYAQINSLAVMAVVNNHLPYDSRYEKEFAVELIKRNRWFKKPLRYEHKAVPDLRVHPDFVLLDTSNPVVIEVYGMNTPEYLARKKEKQSIYSGEEYPYECWDWDAANFKDLAQWILNKPIPE